MIPKNISSISNLHLLRNKYRMLYIDGENLICAFSFRFLNLCLAQSRDLSKDKQNKGFISLSKITLSDISAKKKNSDQNSRNGGRRKILTFCQFPDLPISFCENHTFTALAFDVLKQMK